MAKSSRLKKHMNVKPIICGSGTNPCGKHQTNLSGHAGKKHKKCSGKGVWREVVKEDYPLK